MDKLNLLSHFNLLRELPEKELIMLGEMSKEMIHPKRTIVASPNTPTNTVYLLKKGQVRLYRVNQAGKQFTLDIFTDGNMFGSIGKSSPDSDFYYVETIGECHVCCISNEQFTLFLTRNPSVALKLLDILTVRLQNTYQLSEKIALDPVEDRLLFILNKLTHSLATSDDSWLTASVKLTQADLATMVGSSRETISLIVKNLEENNVIRRKNGFYQLNMNEKVADYR
ncbi:Crp/Fnr family transcriptional regulator [Salipaludibacillus sp. HK11]|uniref:Crp/Fnr family transcriptional regulator n=1 Tax=Salipaludibacillus sp. HK11 TaxID=3394320 RepID=UPI0039FBB9DB